MLETFHDSFLKHFPKSLRMISKLLSQYPRSIIQRPEAILQRPSKYSLTYLHSRVNSATFPEIFPDNFQTISAISQTIFKIPPHPILQYLLNRPREYYGKRILNSEIISKVPLEQFRSTPRRDIRNMIIPKPQ